MVDLTALSGGVKAAYLALVQSKVAGALGLAAEAVKYFEESYERKLQRARIEDLEMGTSDDQVVKEVIAAIRAPFAMDDAKLPIAMGTLFSRVTSVRTAAFNEIRDAHSWSWLSDPTPSTQESAMDGLARAAFITLITEKLAVPCGLDANAVQLLVQKYQTQLQRAIAADLSKSLNENTDPILTQLVSNFKIDDPALANAYTVYTQRATNVKTASEATVKDLLGLDAAATLTGAAADAAIALSVAKLAPVCGLDANVCQLKTQEYTAMIADYRKRQLEEDIALGESSTGAMKTACDEVRATLEIAAGSALDNLALGAAAALCFTKAGPKIGYDANFVQLKEQEYTAKIQEWRKINLNRSLAANTDPILAELLANFRTDDAGLVNAYAIYTQRVTAVRESAYAEIERSHNWRWIDEDWDDETTLETKIAAMDGLTKSAYIALATKMLAVSCGVTPELAQVYEQQYQTRLRAARVADLETTPITDKVQKEVMALIRSTFAGDTALPRDMKTLTDKIDGLKEMARKEVLAAHDWSFAEADYACDASETEYPDEVFAYHVTLPKDAILISACYGEAGKIGQWKLRGREVHAQQHLTRLVYVKDVADFTTWHPKAYRAFILRLVADVAKCVAADPKDRAFQEQLYREALEEAKTCDTRSSNTPDEAWGDNEIADVMLNGRSDRRVIDELLYRD